VILCTGFSGAIDAGDLTRVNVRSLVQKPFTVEQLARAVAETLAGTPTIAGE
jgi:hypothetical protein